MALDAFKSLSSMCRDNWNVRNLAAAGISKIVEKRRQMTSDAFQLCHKCVETDSNVRNSATVGISKIVEKRPQMASDAFGLLSSMCQDKRWNVRSLAVGKFLKSSRGL